MVKRIDKFLCVEIKKEIKISLVAGLILALGVHLFMLTNKFPNHDDIKQMYDNMDRAVSGRWFLFFPAAISGKLSIPFGGILGILYLVIGATFINASFKVKSPICIILINGVLVTFPTVACTLNYMNSADGYFFAMMLSSIAVYLLTNRRGKIGNIFACIFLTLSLGIYQAYFAYAIAALVVFYIMLILIEDIDVIQVVRYGVENIIVLIASLLFYFGIVKVNNLRGIVLSSYKGIDTMGKISIEELPYLISEAYKNSLGFYLKNSNQVHYKYMDKIFMLMFLMVIMMFVFMLVERKRYKALGLLCLMCIIFPLAVGIIYIMVPDGVHMLMKYGYTMVLVLPIILIDKISDDTFESKVICNIVRLSEIVILLTSCLVIVNYSILSNETYFKNFLAYEQTYAYAVNLKARIEGYDEFSKDDTIIFVGTPKVNTGITMSWKKDETQLHQMTGAIDTYVNTKTFNLYMTRYIGVEQNIKQVKQFSIIQELGIEEIVNEMSNYPENESISKYEDMLIVKFSDVLE